MVDLRECEPGDKLLSKHGLILEYVRPLPEEHYYDHLVRYPDIDPYFGSCGSRTHDGFVMKQNRLDSDNDIVEIIKQTK